LRGFAVATLGFVLVTNAYAQELSLHEEESVAAPIDMAIDMELVSQTLSRAETLDRLHGLIVAHKGEPIVERVFHGPGLNRAVNIKSASKTIISALVGIAIEEGVVDGTHAPILPLLQARAPAELDPNVGDITIDHLLTMRAGLERTSGQYYGPWVVSSNWVRYALTRPFVDRPGGGWLYSTGNTHMLSAILTDASGRSTLELAREWLGGPLGFDVPPWTRDPQGTYMGGNEMALSPRALLAFGEMYRNGGVSADGEQVVPASWVKDSWAPKTLGRGGQLYGYGWFISQVEGHPIYFAWGFGGQMLYVAPTLDLTIVATSDFMTRSVQDGYRCALHGLISQGFAPAVIRGGAANTRVPMAARSWMYPNLGGRRCMGGARQAP
jgi:CubicO group peptidase (beta-lactamase class C family)